MDAAAISALKFDEKGLIPAVLQDWRDGTVLMVAYMNRESLEKTLETGIAHFWSRSRKALWEKGATSGHRQRVREIFVDCDQDTPLITVTPEGPACHTGERACFVSRLSAPVASCQGGAKTTESHGGVLDRVYEAILERKLAPTPDSCVASLLKAGLDTILKKATEYSGDALLH